VNTVPKKPRTSQPEQPSPASHSDDNRPWRAFIHQWITNAEIRRDALKALIATLVTVVLIAGIFGGAVTALGHLLGLMLSTTLGKVTTGSAVSLLGIGGGLWRRHRRHQRQTVPDPQNLTPASVPDIADPGDPD
jgi:hypothetical protein